MRCKPRAWGMLGKQAFYGLSHSPSNTFLSIPYVLAYLCHTSPVPQIFSKPLRCCWSLLVEIWQCLWSPLCNTELLQQQLALDWDVFSTFTERLKGRGLVLTYSLHCSAKQYLINIYLTNKHSLNLIILKDIRTTIT